MFNLESLTVALRSLSSNKLRTGLTMLGVIIGVGAVIAVLAIGHGAAARISASISAMGTNLLTVIPGSSRVGGGPGGGGAAITTLTLDDATAILRGLKSSVASVAPISRNSATVRLGNQNTQASCFGTTPDYAVITNSPVMTGRFINNDDVTGRLKVAVVGTTVITNVLGSPDASILGKRIQLNQVEFTVVGVQATKGSGTFGQDQDNVVIIPV